MQGISEDNVFAVIGEEGFARLVEAFYRQVAHDDILRPMYPAGDLPGAEQRLRDFLVFRFGGPGRYLETRGHPRLRTRHAPFAIDQRARDRWVELMENAVRDAAVPEEVAGVLLPFFRDVASFLMNRQGPS